MTDEEREWVVAEAPRLFAVVERDPEFQVAAWGLAFEDSAQVVSEDGTLRMNLQGPESCLHLFRGSELMWVEDVPHAPAACLPNHQVRPG
jgi:hypothetical protein